MGHRIISSSIEWDIGFLAECSSYPVLVVWIQHTNVTFYRTYGLDELDDLTVLMRN